MVTATLFVGFRARLAFIGAARTTLAVYNWFVSRLRAHELDDAPHRVAGQGARFVPASIPRVIQAK